MARDRRQLRWLLFCRLRECGPAYIRRLTWFALMSASELMVTEIAREKAGIIHPGGIVVTLPQQPQANDVIGNTILEMDATAVSAVPYVPPVAPGSDCGYGSRGKYLTTECTEDTERSDHHQPVWRYPLQVMGQKICVETPLMGRHQLRNVALAIAAAAELGKQEFPITAAIIE